MWRGWLTVTGKSENAPSPVEVAYREWSDALLRFAWSITRDWSLASDAVSAAFLAFAKSVDSVESDAHKAWLYKVVFRQAVRLREERSQAVEVLVEDLASDFLRGDALPLNRMIEAENLERIGVCIQSLPEEQRQMIQLRIYEGMTFSQIAEQLAIPLGTALSRMRLAIEKIREALQ